MKSEFESNRLDLLAELDMAEMQLSDQYESYIDCADIELCEQYLKQIAEIEEHIKILKEKLKL